MRSDLEWMRTARAAAGFAALIVLSACGGGDPPDTRPRVSSSAGDASRYLGRWTGDCALATVAPQTLTTVKNTFVITAANGNVATGTLRVETFTDLISCNGASTQQTYAVTLTLDPTPVDASGTVVGQADKVTLTTTPTTGATTIYIAMTVARDRMWIGSTANYTERTVSYQWSAP